MRRFFPIAFTLLVGCAEAATDQASEPVIGLIEGLGDHHHAVTTRSPEAQRFFDQGLALTYGFNHADAIRSFREATRLDGECAMCWFGIALASGPNINAAMDSASGAAAYEAVENAAGRAQMATEPERALIEALTKRYAPVPGGPRAALDTAYANAMRDVATRYPDDDDVATLYAEALMLLSPWNYWTDGKPRPQTPEILATLERVIERNPNHAGACHFYIHAVEAAQPERAVACAERLPSLMPGAGHIVHMPAHIYIRVGRYADAVEANVHAAHADEAILEDITPDGAYKLAYYPHNYHFLWFAASMSGQSARALEAARQLATKVDTSMMRAPGLGALQHFLITPMYALVRFGRWDDILREPAPPADLVYPTGIWHYARALAFTAQNKLDEAAAELPEIERARDNPAIEGMLFWDLNSARAVLAIATEAAAAELAAKRGDRNKAITHLRKAIELEDGLTYDEPPTWHLPVRQQLGAILLSAGRPAEAETAYRQDLERHPKNGWSLYGLTQSLRAQNRAADARAIDAEFKTAWQSADIQLTASRF
jgi:tetratricopeptide (TPR) repeat protein